MTKAIFHRSAGVYRIHIDGHALFNPGNDIVCSAGSILAYTILQCLLAEQHQNHLQVCKTEVDEPSGHVYVKVRPRPDYKQHVDSVIYTVATGFALLQKNYPDNVRYEYRGD